VPALQYAQQLRKTIQVILDAPSEIASLRQELLSEVNSAKYVQQTSECNTQPISLSATIQYPSTDKTPLPISKKKSFLIQNAQFHLNGAWPKIEVIYMKQAVSQREFHVVSYYATLFCVV
jgi:hypothetical protein